MGVHMQARGVRSRRAPKGILVLLEHLGWLLYLTVDGDGNPSYRLFTVLQRCWRHLLGHIEAPAVDGDAGDRARHEQGPVSTTGSKR